ncbi:MAG TPA: hypothetical protein VM661_10565 [Candidatus Sulfotelmatobacter sp.]|nr:hypothetical protein [Candidatus Sulfotelmatobacter sp.]
MRPAEAVSWVTDSRGPSWAIAAPVLLFLAGLMLMRLGAAEVLGNLSQSPPAKAGLIEIVGD